MTKTHYAELFNNILYGLATAQALVTFSNPLIFSDTQSKTTTQKIKKDAEPISTDKYAVQPIYPDVSPDDLEIMQ